MKNSLSMALATAAMSFLLAFPSSAQTELEEGKPSPAFAATDMDGRSRSLADLKGQKLLLLTFFPKCFTFNCTSQITSLRDVYPELQKADVEVWGVSTDEAKGPKGQQAYARHLKLPFPLLPDTQRKICLLYGAVQSPNQMAARMSILIDKEGTIRWIDKQLSPLTHGQDVVDRLKAEGIIEAKEEAETKPANP